MIWFSRPALLVLLALVPWYWLAGRGWVQGVPRLALVSRCLAVVMLVLAVAGLQVRWAGPASVMFVVDRSESVSAEVQSRALEIVRRMTGTMREGDRCGLVVFGGEAAVERPLSQHLAVHNINSVVSESDTNIEQALRISRLSLPRDGARRIVLVSDGRETSGDAMREARLSTADGIEIDTVPAGGAGAARPRRSIVAGVFAPPDVRISEPFSISVAVEGVPGSRARLLVHRDSAQTFERLVTVGDSGTAIESFTDVRNRAGIECYRAEVAEEGLEAFDTPPAGTVVTVTGTPSLLYVSSAPRVLNRLFSQSGFHVSTVAPGSVSSSVANLSEFDAIVLDDVPPDALDAAQAEAIAQYVKQNGGGLLLLGGPRSLGADGYATGPLGPVLPVDIRPPGGQRARNMAFALVFDKSGSMSARTDGIPKIQLARDAVMRVLDAMSPTDQFSAVAFDASAMLVVPPGTSRDSIADRLRAIEPGGATSIAPAVQMAIGWLQSAHVATRNLLLISDGRTSPADAARLRALLKNAGVQVSVVAIGADADRALFTQIASDTGGRAYFPENARELPRIAAREAERSSGGRLVQEAFSLRSIPHPILAGLPAALPRLGGYVVTSAKAGAEPVLLSHLDDPVLCAWRFGLGRVAVFTADVASRWSAPLRGWSGFGPLWTNTVRWASRRTLNQRLRVTTSSDRTGARVVVDAEEADGTFFNYASIRGRLRGPDGEEHEMGLRAVAPGRYEAALEHPAEGLYTVAVDARDASGTEEHSVRGFYFAGARERAAAGVDTQALTRLAQATGGTMMTESDNPFAAPRSNRQAYRDAGHILTIGALALFLLSVLLPARFLA